MMRASGFQHERALSELPTGDVAWNRVVGLPTDAASPFHRRALPRIAEDFAYPAFPFFRL